MSTVNAANNAANNNSDIILFSEHNPPFVYKNDEGKYVGSSIEYLEPILKLAKISYELKTAPWNRAIAMTMAKNNVLIYPLARFSEREKSYKWIIPIHRIELRVIGLKENVDISIADIAIKNYKIVCANNTIQCSALKSFGIPESSLVRIAHIDDQQMVKMVLAKRVDFMMIAEEALKYSLKDLKSNRNKFIALNNYKYQRIEYLAGNKNFDPSLADRIIKAAKELEN